MDANRDLPAYELKSELARFCLPAANRDVNRKLAWVNSICILFLLIGVLGAKPAHLVIRRPPPIEEIIPAIVEPPPPPPQTTTEQVKPDESDQEKPQTPQVVVVTPEAPNINFSVPTIGNVVVPNGAMSAPPPLRPMQQVAPLKNVPASLTSTGSGGERPEPKYPKMAEDQGMQGRVVLSMTADANGMITSIEVKQSRDFRCWIGPPWIMSNAIGFFQRVRAFDNLKPRLITN